MAWSLKRDDEIIVISAYGFDWYKGGQLQRSGLVENLEEEILALEDEGFSIIE